MAKTFPLLVPAGNDTEVQFNDGGIFGADSLFTYNSGTTTVQMPFMRAHSGWIENPGAATDLIINADADKAAKLNLRSGEVNRWLIQRFENSDNLSFHSFGTGGGGSIVAEWDFATGAATFTGLTLSNLTDTRVLFNNAGVISDDSRFTFDDSTGTLVAGSATIAPNTAVFQPGADSTTAFQWKQAGGGVIGNFDTTNIRLGIGTVDPLASIHVIRNDAIVRVSSDGALGAGDAIGFEIQNVGINTYGIGIDESVNNGEVILFRREGVGGTTIFALDQIGRWGLGTELPQEEIDIQTSAISPEIKMVAYSTTETHGAIITLGASDTNTKGLEVETSDGRSLGKIEFKGVNSGSFFDNAAAIVVLQNGANALFRVSADMHFLTGSTIVNPTTRMIITNLGDIGFGGELTPETLLELTHATPTITGHVSTHSDADNSGAWQLRGKREQSGGEETESGTITMSHDGTGDDQLTKMVFAPNTGAGVVDGLTIDSGLDVTATMTKMTAIGGFAVKLTNNTGGNSVEGQLVMADTTDENSFDTAATNALDTIGVVYNGGVADGSDVWIVIGGIAEVLLDAGGCVHNDRLISSATAGSADVGNSPSIAEHFQEIGHAIETVVGAGLAKAMIHIL